MNIINLNFENLVVHWLSFNLEGLIDLGIIGQRLWNFSANPIVDFTSLDSLYACLHLFIAFYNKGNLFSILTVNN